MESGQLLQGPKVLMSVNVPSYWYEVIRSCASGLGMNQEQWVLWAAITTAIDDRNKGELFKAILQDSPIIKAGA